MAPALLARIFGVRELRIVNHEIGIREKLAMAAITVIQGIGFPGVAGIGFMIAGIDNAETTHFEPVAES